jgi:crotonobetainyl-CoA:carnitine CoA-transferase CaiB-like acyl-CoA transferase
LPNGRKTKLPKIPIRLNNESFDIRSDPPEIGAQTADILQELGFSQDEIIELEKKEVVRSA